MVLKTLFVLSLAAVTAGAAPPTQGERDRALSELHATTKAFLDSIDGLSEAQWTYKPAPETWSIAEVAEHIALSEDALFELATAKLLQSPAQAPRDRAAVQKLDAKVLESVADRTQKAKAPEFLQPGGKWPNKAKLVEAFRQSRGRTIAFIRETDEDLRAHRMANETFGELDAYQWILLIAAHSDRHTKQIKEVAAAPDFPTE
jgi:hypothetical protein